jgi:hypothetical protein
MIMMKKKKSRPNKHQTGTEEPTRYSKEKKKGHTRTNPKRDRRYLYPKKIGKRTRNRIKDVRTCGKENQTEQTDDQQKKSLKKKREKERRDS